MGVGKKSKKAHHARRRSGPRRRLRVERLTERRVLAAITGLVFEDANFSFQQEAEEAGLGGRLLYLDINQNAAIDSGEPFALGREDGSFKFEDLADGAYALRLYNGTDSQEQTFPIEARPGGQAVPIDGGVGLLVTNETALALTDQTIEIADFEKGESQSITVGTNLTAMQTLPNGNVIVIGGPTGSDTAWLVNPSLGTVDPINLAGSESVVWSQIAIDGEGYGLAIGHGSNSVEVRMINGTEGDLVQSSSVSETVPAGTTVITSATGGRSVLASAGTDGLQVSLWSNSTGTLISGTPVDIDDSTGLLAFDDASGLLVLRSDDGGVTVHDADANFATLRSLPELTGPVALDAARHLLLTVSPESSLQLYDVRDGDMVADLNVDLDGVGSVSNLQFDGDQRSLVVLGSRGMASVSLEAGAHRFTVTGGEDPEPVSIGVRLDGENGAPEYQAPPSFEMLEDTQLIRTAPGVRTGASDPDDDSFVVVRTAPPNHGSATVYPNGSLIYTPHPDFFGTDVFTVLAHDGRDYQGSVTVQVDVLPLPDAPTGITVQLNPIPENALPGHVVGPIIVNDVDLNDNHEIELNDDRFIVKNGKIIFINGQLNFETEPLIGVEVYVGFPEEPGYLIENIFFQVSDENDPITAISPVSGTVKENDPGAAVALLKVDDEDIDSDPTFSVDDDRFVIMDNSALRLADGVSLDYEAEPVVTVNITAKDGDSFTQEFKINVIDQPEQVTSIDLSNQSVLELSPGDEVGQILINGQQPQDSYTIYVSDPRFEVVGSTLKLVDDQWVERASQEEIQLTITAQDVSREYEAFSETFVIEVIENQTPYHNEDSPFDVDGNGKATAADALVIINYLNIYGPGPVGFGDPAYGYDVNGDGMVTALDALLILNELNRLQMLTGGTVGGEREGPEGEQVQPQETAPQQPKHIAPQQPQDLILPQQIAAHSEPAYDERDRGADEDNSAQSVAGTSYDPSVVASAYARGDQASSASSSDSPSDEDSRRVDEALESVILNDYIG